MIAQGIALQAKRDFLIGLHQPGDDYRLALYTKSATITPELQNYTEQGEVKGPGYAAGGVKLTGFKTGAIGKNAYVTFDDIKIARASFTAHGAIVYNASKNNAVLCTLNFGGDRSVYDGAFELKFPVPTENDALILLA